jgi:hypothetical protein
MNPAMYIGQETIQYQPLNQPHGGLLLRMLDYAEYTGSVYKGVGIPAHTAALPPLKKCCGSAILYQIPTKSQQGRQATAATHLRAPGMALQINWRHRAQFGAAINSEVLLERDTRPLVTGVVICKESCMFFFIRVQTPLEALINLKIYLFLKFRGYQRI